MSELCCCFNVRIESGDNNHDPQLEEIITAGKRPYVDSRENKRKWTDSSQVTQSYLILQMNKSTHTHMRCSDKPCHQSETSCESDADGFEDPELRPQPVVGQVPMMFNIIN